MQRNIEFEIGQLIAGTEDAFVDGRNCGSPIRVGDVFAKICRRIIKGNGKDSVSAEVVSETFIHLTVISIEAYRNHLEELSSGMTARLKIKGSGIEKLKEGKVLSGNSLT